MSSRATDPGADGHRPDPGDERLCLCGHLFDHDPTDKEWEEHIWGGPGLAGAEQPRERVTLTDDEKGKVQIEVAALRAGHVHMRDVFATVESILTARLAEQREQIRAGSRLPGQAPGQWWCAACGGNHPPTDRCPPWDDETVWGDDET